MVIYSLFGTLFYLKFIFPYFLWVVVRYEIWFLYGFNVPPMYGSKLKKMRMIFDFRLLGMQFIIEVSWIEIWVDFVWFSLRIGVLGLVEWVIDDDVRNEIWDFYIFELDVVWEFMPQLLDSFRENWLSVKMLINKEESCVKGVIFCVVEFWKLGCEVGEMVGK